MGLARRCSVSLAGRRPAAVSRARASKRAPAQAPVETLGILEVG